MSPTAAWAISDNPVADISVNPVSLLGKGAGVVQTCVKEALTNEVSPLGFHLSSTVKDKIWLRVYVDI